MRSGRSWCCRPVPAPKADFFRTTTRRCCTARWSCSASGISAGTWGSISPAPSTAYSTTPSSCSRALMVTAVNNPGILDFQDAVLGPVTYDLVSLLRDCYIAWPRARVEEWVKGYHDLALQSGLPVGADDAVFLRWFDLMGVQRHLKATGIFARLNHRDGKPGYLGDIPRTLGYVREVSARYPELQPLQALLRELKLPGVA